MEYLKKLTTLIIALLIWIGIPILLAQMYNNPGLTVFVIVTWIPALFAYVHLEY